MTRIPSGAAVPGHKKTGGRKPGTPNKRTVYEREMIAQAHREGRSPRDIMLDILDVYRNLAARHQPLPPGITEVPKGRQPDEQKFRFYSRAAIDTADRLMPYLHPRLAAIMMSTPGQSEANAMTTLIEGSAVELHDEVSAAEVYQRMIGARAA